MVESFVLTPYLVGERIGLHPLAVIFALKSWRRQVTEGQLPAERLVGAVRAGARYARHSPELRTVLVRLGAFVIFASASLAAKVIKCSGNCASKAWISG